MKRTMNSIGHLPSLPRHKPRDLRLRLSDELAHGRSQAQADLLPWILSGEVEQALDHLVYFAEPRVFATSARQLVTRMQSAFTAAPLDGQRFLLRFSAELALRLRSFLPGWNLSSAALHPSTALSPDDVSRFAGDWLGLAASLAKASPEAANCLLAAWRSETTARLRAEAVEDPEAEASAIVGESVTEYIEAVAQSVANSNLGRVAGMRLAGATRTEISNDYAAFLPYTLLLGASFVTCNPPLVDMALKAEPARWDPVVDGLIASHRKADGDALARLVTLEIVLANMRRLRPIFLLTEGRMGCVSLQVNPKLHDDAATMLRDAAAIYAEFERRLDGGVPNVVFKLPATYAGLQACRSLTAAGIGVNITVNFGLFQHLRFAEAISEGEALFSTLAHMAGRLAYPVRDELLVRLDELSALGISEAQARQAAAWSGVAVLKRLHRCLGARGTDLGHVRPLIASLRVYTGDAYAGLPSPIPDITETIGTGILTVFPNVRRAFDRLPKVALDGDRINASVPNEIFDVLRRSEVFKQAYWLGPLAVSGESDPAELRPLTPLSLENRAGTAGWAPVANTLNEFCKAYDSFVDSILARRSRYG
jgi:hypothetical protein